MDTRTTSIRLHRRARCELIRIHRAELARALRGAARLSLELRTSARLYLPELDLDRATRRWERRAARALELLASDELELLDAELVRRCLGTPLADWPLAEELAEASLLACDGLAGRVRLAQAALVERAGGGAAPRAIELLQRAIALPLAPRMDLAVALEWLAYAHEAAGRDWLALGACEAAGREPWRTPDALLSGLLLALRLGDARRARWFRGELADAGEAGLADGLARLGARDAHARAWFARAPRRLDRALVAEIHRCGSRAERAALALAQGEAPAGAHS